MPGAYRVRIPILYVSAKITIRESDGTEYQLKARIANMVLAAGYSERLQRGLHVMIGISLVGALRLAMRENNILPPREPEGLLLYYPIKDQSSYSSAQRHRARSQMSLPRESSQQSRIKTSGLNSE